MPNIEIHGPGAVYRKVMKSNMVRCLEETELSADIVISEYDVALNLWGSPRPYLRVACTDAAEAQRVVDLLKPLHIDMEVLLLHAFIPSQSQ